MRIHWIKGGAIILILGVLLKIFFGSFGYLLIVIGVISLIIGVILPGRRRRVVRRIRRRRR